jgi:hypothetical protein
MSCKAILDECLQICQKYISKAVQIQPNLDSIYSNLVIRKEEFAIQSRYLHRGFYCPSPDIEYIITNMRRGKIAKRVDARTQPTNRYLFDDNGKLRYAETYYPNGFIEAEYIFHDENLIFGFIVDSSDRISVISVAQYSCGTILSCLWAHCTYRTDSSTYTPRWIMYEKYNYDGASHLETDFYGINLSNHFGSYDKYRFHLDLEGNIIKNTIEQLQKENGWL